MLNNMKKNILNKKEEGFTLIETLIAVLILVVSVVTPLSIASQAMVYSATARDQIIASNLAQEAIDFIRNERDRSALNNPGPIPNRFDNFLDKFGVYTSPSTYCFSSAGCAIDVRRPTYRGAAPAVNEIIQASNFNYNDEHVIDLTTCTASNSCPTLSLQSLGASPTYTYGYIASGNASWRETSFRRKVNMTVIGNIATPQEVLITVTMTWRTGSYDNSLIMNEYLKSWADGII